MYIEIEKIERVRNVPDAQQKEQGSAKLAAGDVFVCKVIEKKEHSVMLKSENGNIFTAKIIGDIRIAVGDNVEIIVNHTDNGQYTLQVLDIHSHVGKQKTAQQENHSRLPETFEQNQDKSAKQLVETLTMLKRNPGIGPKTAAFISKNNIAVSAENVEIITQLIEGSEKTGSILSQILSGVFSSINKIEGKAVFENNETQAVKPGKQEKSETLAKGKFAEKEPVQNLSTDNKSQVRLYINNDVGRMFKKYENNAQNNIIEKIQAIFCSLEKEKRTGLQIKNAIADMPEKLKELKILLNNYDNENKDAYMQKIDRLEKQITLMADIKRFNCLQFPYNLNDNETRTAELFVYRYKRKKQKEDTENYLILLGLDTQNLGRVETLIKVKQKNISLLFRLEENEIIDYVLDEKELLGKAVQDTGYRITDIKAVKLEKKITVVNAEEFLAKQAKEKSQNVDVRI